MAHDDMFEDDVAKGLADECDNCGELERYCDCYEDDPDRLHDEMNEL